MSAALRFEAGVRATTAALAVFARTWRHEYPMGYHTHPERALFAFWHAELLMHAWEWRHRGAGVLVSRHRDGEWATRVLERLGFVIARGSSTRSGGPGALGMLRYAAEGRSLGITPDGPRGPARRAKPGAVRIAAASGLPIVAVAAIPHSAWRLRSWDRFMIPRPFTRIRFLYGTPIEVPRTLDEEAERAWTATLEAALDALGGDTAAQAGP